MNIQTPSQIKLLRLLFTLLGILALTTSTGLSAIPNRTHSPLALVRVDFQNSSDLQRFAATGLPVYAQLQTAQGSSYLLLPATREQQDLLSHLGFAVRVLDEDAGVAGMGYYLLYARDRGQIRQASRSVTILEQGGRQAIAKAAPEQAERLGAPGIEIVQLKLHPLVVPQTTVENLPEVINPDPVIQGMIDQVDSQTVYDYDAGLSGEFPVLIGGEPYTITTRYTDTSEPIQKATQYTYEHFEALGLPVQYHTYNLGGVKRNVVAEQPGVSQPERIFLVTAHLDSSSDNPYDLAPGADDNASGSIGVLIAADILSQYSFDCTIRYALFTGEEQGLVGSYEYAQAASSNGDDIEGVLNLDMIAHNSDLLPQIELHTRPNNQSDLAIANLFSDVVDAYDLNLVPEIVQDGISASDHYSFWQVGYPAILGIEDFDDFTPYYHTTGDQVETLDMEYFTTFVKAAVGTLAHMGCPLGAAIVYPNQVFFPLLRAEAP